MKFPVAEIFGPTIQGEGMRIGTRASFVRFGGCDYRCSWCDSMHAVDPRTEHNIGDDGVCTDLHGPCYLEDRKAPWEKLEAEQIVEALYDLGGDEDWIILSGGNPCLYPLGELVGMLQENGWNVAVETQGSKAPEWLTQVDHLTISPKPPSAGQVTPFEQVRACWLTWAKRSAFSGASSEIKVVIFGDADLDYAERLFKYLTVNGVHPNEKNLSVGTPPGRSNDPVTLEQILERYRALIESTKRLPTVDRILPQMHWMLWGNDRGR